MIIVPIGSESNHRQLERKVIGRWKVDQLTVDRSHIRGDVCLSMNVDCTYLWILSSRIHAVLPRYMLDDSCGFMVVRSPTWAISSEHLSANGYNAYYIGYTSYCDRVDLE